MYILKLATIALMIFTSSLASAMVRIVPENTYGKATESKFDPITDHLQNIGTRLQGQPMGGAYDIVYTSNISSGEDDSQVMILRCPSLRQCSDTKENCLTQAKYWQCEQIYEASPAATCKTYRKGKISRSVLGFVATEVLESLLISPIAFFGYGVGLAITNGSAAIDLIKEIKEIRNMSCNSMPAILNGGPLDSAKLTLKIEDKKGQVKQMISIFTPNHKHMDKDEPEFFNQKELSIFPLPVQLIPPTELNLPEL